MESVQRERKRESNHRENQKSQTKQSWRHCSKWAGTGWKKGVNGNHKEKETGIVIKTGLGYYRRMTGMPKSSEGKKKGKGGKGLLGLQITSGRTDAPRKKIYSNNSLGIREGEPRGPFHRRRRGKG